MSRHKMLGWHGQRAPGVWIRRWIPGGVSGDRLWMDRIEQTFDSCDVARPVGRVSAALSAPRGVGRVP